jgi:hypothetical protein
MKMVKFNTNLGNTMALSAKQKKLPMALQKAILKKQTKKKKGKK